MSKALKSIEEHNKERWHLATMRSPNGVACPACGHELRDSDELLIATYPAKKCVHCPACDWKGTVLA